MPRASKVPNKLSPQDNRGLELARQKLKIRNQKDEIDNLKRSFKQRDRHIAGLQMANNYLNKAIPSSDEN